MAHSRSLTETDDPEELYQGALAVGRFLHAFRDLPPEMLQVMIPRFHDTPDRFRLLRAAAEADPLGRLCHMREELDFVLQREARSRELTAALQSGALPLRVIQGDTHLSNVLFHETRREALRVIDFDSIMPGLAAWDFGDLVRSAACAEEEETAFSRERYDILLQGFLGGYPDLSGAERESPPLRAWTMTLESGVRYLTDHLEGDRVFRAVDPEQNLRKARRQLRLPASMEAYGFYLL